MRFLSDTWLDEFEAKGEAMLPPNWEEMTRLYLRTIDSRLTKTDAAVLKSAVKESEAEGKPGAAEPIGKVSKRGGRGRRRRGGQPPSGGQDPG
jgi:hypothetical protein